MATTSADCSPEFARAERFDGVFFLDLPEQEEKEAIWSIHRASFGIDADQVIRFY